MKEAALAAGARAIEAAERAEERPGIVDTLLGPGGVVSGAISLAGLVGLNLYRSRTRRRALKATA